MYVCVWYINKYVFMCVYMYMYMWETGQCQKSLSIALYLTFGGRASHCRGINENCPP